MDSIAQDPLDRIQLADQCGLSEWLYPAYAKLCARDASLTAEEGRRLGFERYAALSRIREDDFKAIKPARAAQSASFVFGGPMHGSDVQVFGRPAELQPNCKNDCCKPPFGLSSKEQQFVAKVAGAAELKVD
ncbi:hypothetical protein FRC04_002155 [Tulasnella sp. 424]|nr:hypothetical protein FRC04_002155 [Tulasnella sp. 424]KAG8967798.1 hypothetical protein FRC05_001894 [Tulasnella sp. 425]